LPKSNQFFPKNLLGDTVASPAHTAPVLEGRGLYWKFGGEQKFARIFFPLSKYVGINLGTFQVSSENLKKFGYRYFTRKKSYSNF